MSNTVNTSNQARPVNTVQTGDSGKELQNFESELYSAVGEFRQLLKQELKKTAPGFRQLEQKVESFLKNHKNLFELVKEEQGLKGKKPNQLTAQQKDDMQRLKECLEMLQECDKILTAIKKYIDELKQMMNDITQNITGTLFGNYPELDFTNVPQNDYELNLPGVPGTGSTSKV